MCPILPSLLAGVPFFYLSFMETQDALIKLKGAGGTPEQNAELVRTILATTRFSAADANDAALEAECKAKDVEKNFYTFTDASAFRWRCASR